MTLTTISPRQRDEATLRSLSPLEVAAYLRVSGWREQRREQDKFALWTWPNNPDEPEDFFEVLLPLRTQYRDFAPRMAELLDTLEQAEERSQQEILQDLSTTNADIVRVGLLGSQAADGSISLDTNALVSQRVHDLMLAAACAAVAPRAAYQTRKPNKAIEYLKGVRAGQTERGSYIVTILSPVAPSLAPDLEQATAPQGEEPFERQVVRCLITALDAARGAAETSAATGTLKPFEEAVGRGVSANLCEAIADLAEAGGGAGMEVGCSWSRSRPAPKNVPQRVFINQDVVPFVRAAARAFRETSLREEEAEVRGFVEVASKRTDAATGKVVIVGTVNGQPRRVVAKLTGEDYKAAVRAHEAEVPIVCFGRIVREGPGFVLKNPRDFQPE